MTYIHIMVIFDRPCAIPAARNGGTRSVSGAYIPAFVKASAGNESCGMRLQPLAKDSATACAQYHRGAAFGLRSQGLFGEDGLAKQGVKWMGVLSGSFFPLISNNLLNSGATQVSTVQNRTFSTLFCPISSPGGVSLAK